MKIRQLNPTGLEEPPGYSQLVDVAASRLVFISGQAGVVASGVAIGPNFRDQAEQAFRNLATALQAVGCNAGNVVKLTVFVRDIERLAEYRSVRDRFFRSVDPPAAPAVTLVEVSRLYGKDLLIEIEAIAAM